MRKLLKQILVILLILSAICGCSNNNGLDNTSATGDIDILSILFHQPYLNAVGIPPHHKSDRKQVIDKIEKALQENPCIVTLKDGGLFGKDYYAVTQDQYFQKVCYYYGDTKSNRPNGFGVLSSSPVDLNDYSSLNQLIYAGNFKKGRFNGYGASFCAQTEDVRYTINFVDDLIANKKLSTEYRTQAIAYLRAFVTYDGDWKDGKKNGEGNIFEISAFIIDKREALDGYWGGPCYPISVHVSEIKDEVEHGEVKVYSNGLISYDGEMKNGKKHGDGIDYYSNGQVLYDGHWKNGKHDGKGKYYNEDGSLIYDGKWEDGDYAS